MALPRVLPDTNVCYPMWLLDLVLRCDEAALISVLWTEDLLDELTRTWVAKGVRSAVAAERSAGIFVRRSSGRTFHEPSTSHSFLACRAPIPTITFTLRPLCPALR